MAVNERAIKLQQPGSYGNTTNELLYAIMGNLNCIGYEKIDVDDTAVKQLTVPQNTLMALLVVEADQTSSDLNKVIRFTEDNVTVPTNSAGTDEGMPLGDRSILEVKGFVNPGTFKMIGREAGKTHRVSVQYYG